MLSRGQILVTVSLIVFMTNVVSTAEPLEYSSYIFTTEDIIFFSYQNETHLEIYDSEGELIWDNDGVALDIGQHAIATDDISQGIYKVAGSNKFAVLTGDPTTNGVSGYYAMDANGLGVSNEFYTYVPWYVEYGQKFIIFAYETSTSVTVQEDVSNGNYVTIASFTLNEGQHWANTDPDLDLSNKWLHVVADKPISALTCHD